MDDAEPAICETFQQMIDNDGKNYIEEIKIKDENDEYNVKFEAKENGLMIKVSPESLKNLMYYQQYYTLYNLQKISQIFSAYKNIKDVIKVLKDFKFEIQKKNGEVIIKFNAFMPNGQQRLIELNLKKYLSNDKEIVKYVFEEIILMKKDMKKKEEKYNAEIIKNENEIKKLKEDISKAEAEISFLKKENVQLWEIINPNHFKKKKKRKNIILDFQPNNQKSYNLQKNYVINNNSNINNNNIYNTQIIGNMKNSEKQNQNLSKSNITPNDCNNIIEDEDEIDEEIYSYEVLEKNPDNFTRIYDGKEVVGFEFTIMNTSNNTFPGDGKSKLIFYKNNINCIREMDLRAMKPGDKEKITIEFPRERFFGKYNRIFVGLKIEEEIYGEALVLTVISKYDMIQEFRYEYELKKEDYDDEALFNRLIKYNFKFEDSFASLFQG